MAVSDYVVAVKLTRKHNQARDRGIDCSLSFRRMKQLLNTKRCYYTRVEITPENFSLDRKDTSLGYTDKNTVVCDDALNKRKGDLTLKEIKALNKGLEKKRKK